MVLNNKSIIAITGPSGVGKTTLGNKLAENDRKAIPLHCKTRQPRADDIEGFYRYLSHEKYKKLFDDKAFLISSGDGPTIDKKYGNFYGVLKDDCVAAWMTNDIIILFVSYKDISTLIDLKNHGLDIAIIDLRFKNIENGVVTRLTADIKRQSTNQEIQKRINCAKADNETYGELLKLYSTCMIYTDTLGIEETQDEVCNTLKIKKKKKETLKEE